MERRAVALPHDGFRNNASSKADASVLLLAVGLLTELMWVSQHVLACVSDISLPEPIRKAGMVLAGKALAQVRVKNSHGRLV